MTPAWIAYPDWFPRALLVAFVCLQSAFVVVHALRPKYRRLHRWSAPWVALRNSLPGLIIQLFLWLSLIALLAPWWWLSVLGVHLLERGGGTGLGLTPTRVFLVSVGAFVLSWYARGWWGRRANRKFEGSRESDERAPTVRKRVAVIGAGMAGLVAAKELREEGHEVVVYERTQGWGGVWAASKKKGGRAWAGTSTSTSSLNSTFSDSPTPIYHPENGDTPLHYTRQQFYDMLAAYERRYSVFSDSLRCGRELVAMDALEGGRWRLTIAVLETGGREEEEFDAVTVCTGLNHRAWSPRLPGRGSFEGPELHVDDYDPAHPEAYAGKRVLVVGTGETAADLSKELLDHGAEHIYVSQRGATLILPRNNASVPPDYVESRVSYAGPMFHRWAMLLGGTPVTAFRSIQPARVRLPSPIHWIRLLTRPFNPIAVFPSLVASVNNTKSDLLWFALDSGRATLVRRVEEVRARGVRLEGGEDIEVDAILYCTGYRPGESLLPGAEGAPRLDPRALYKLTIVPEHPTVAVIGLARGNIGAITVSSEMQARWWALLVSGKRALPDASTMARAVERLRAKTRHFAQPTRTTMTFANSLARHDIGCEPDMFALFVRDRRLWWALLNGVICSAHYRLHGVHAKPKLAREQLERPYALMSEDYIDSVDIALNVLPLSFLVVPLWAPVQTLLPVFALESALSSYV